MSYVIKMAQVESVDDIADGLRIKARLEQDGKSNLKNLPYAFPLLPKTLQTVPKIGECVLIICSELENNLSNRYYIGPIISQPQKQEYDSYSYGRGTALNLLQGGSLEPLERLSKYEQTKGSFPNVNDVAIVGRKSEDIILKDGEIDIRCGIRGKTNDGNKNLVGDVVFNENDPAYVQLKYSNGIGFSETQEANSVANIVADKINLISHKDDNKLSLTDKEELIKTSEMDDIMQKLHKSVYGDELVKKLEIMREFMINHVHPYPGLPPCDDHYKRELVKIDFNELLSDNVRIS